MGFKIFISSAVESKEKEAVKAQLEDMKKKHHIMYDCIYDCNEHSTTYQEKSKQEIIDEKIVCETDWFICLIPENHVGHATRVELQDVMNAKKEGAPVVISVFHPVAIPEDILSQPIPDGRDSFEDIQSDVKRILGSSKNQYEVSYQYGNMESLCKAIAEEYDKLNRVDQEFRTLHLAGLAKMGSSIKASDIYFDRKRSEYQCGFLEDKYFPRRRVDGKLREELDDNRKIIVLTGAPGSGKTRAIYQLFANAKSIASSKKEVYALGRLSDQQAIIVRQENVRQVFEFLKSEAEYTRYEKPLSAFYLVCDQLKDVLAVLPENERIEFLDHVKDYPHVRLLATSTTSSFNNMAEKWKDNGRNYLSDSVITGRIDIPLISADQEAIEIRTWMLTELHYSTIGETIGDFIPKLYQYKQHIVERLYQEQSTDLYLSDFLKSLQITEIYRYDTALFLPVLLVQRQSVKNGESCIVFKDKMAKTLNFLIANNFIWVKDGKGRLMNYFQEGNFGLDQDDDDPSDFEFDNEVFLQTSISTRYSYVVNEIVWSHLIQEDDIRRLRDKGTLLYDLQNKSDVVKMAKRFYNTFLGIRSLYRILPRIPRTDCYEEAIRDIWNFVYEKCKESQPDSSNERDYLLAVGMLIGRANSLQRVEESLQLLKDKEIAPEYNIVGELYGASMRLNTDTEAILQHIDNIRRQYDLQHHDFFSLARLIESQKLTFDEAVDSIVQTKYVLPGRANNAPVQYSDIKYGNCDSKIQGGVDRLFKCLAKMAETTPQWNEIFGLYLQIEAQIQLSIIRTYFSSFNEECAKQRNLGSSKESDSMVCERLMYLLIDQAAIVTRSDEGSCYYYAIQNSWNFRQAVCVYRYYLEKNGSDDQKLLSLALQKVVNSEFQLALNYLDEVNQRLSANGNELNSICYNNLIKNAPNAGEALAVVPYIRHIQDYTISNILSVLRKRRINDHKIFYYAYAIVMQFGEQFGACDQFGSPYVIGILFELATTIKHERFIREVFLKDVSESDKRKLIDYSPEVVSIRLKKNYLGLDDVWKIFNTCRLHYQDANDFVSSSLYSTMMWKLSRLCKSDKDNMNSQQAKLYDIIMQDINRIVRDENFYSSMYRFMPGKTIFGEDNQITADFQSDMNASNITQIRHLSNIILKFHDEWDFATHMAFFDFILSYYKSHSRRFTLRPEYRTITFLMEKVSTKEQFAIVCKIAETWLPDQIRKNNSYYKTAVFEAKERIAVAVEQTKQESKEQKRKSSPTIPNFEAETNEIINLAKRDIHYYGVLTPTVLNNYLQRIVDIYEYMDKNLRKDVIRKCKPATYYNLLSNLIDEKDICDKISFDIQSYTMLIMLSPDKGQAGKWMECILQMPPATYQYNLLTCATIAQTKAVAMYDIELSRRFFRYWEDIMRQVGYDPADSTSVSSYSESKEYKGCEDYDGYWYTRRKHAIRETEYYVRTLQQNSEGDKVALRLLREERKHFQQYGIPFFSYRNGGQEIDFDKEFSKLDE